MAYKLLEDGKPKDSGYSIEKSWFCQGREPFCPSAIMWDDQVTCATLPLPHAGSTDADWAIRTLGQKRQKGYVVSTLVFHIHSSRISGIPHGSYIPVGLILSMAFQTHSKIANRPPEGSK